MNRNITAIILIVLAIGTYMTFTSAKLVEVRAVQDVNKQYLSAIDSADKLIKLRDSVLQDYNNITQGDRARLDKMLPNTVDNIRLIIDLNSVALKRGFPLHNIRAVASGSNKGSTLASVPTAMPQAFINDPGAPSTIPTPVLDTVTVSFSVTAPYQQFIDLLRDLEANLRIMDVTHLSVAAGTVSGSYDFGVELKTYWLRQQ
jgi:Tfp pilus assembly protein PilO